MPRTGSDEARILVVDDEPEIRAILCKGLAAEGFVVAEAADKAQLLAQLGGVDLITLDVGLGAQNGLELAREVRAIRNIPIVMITGRAEPFDRVAGLEHGADDYVTKPFHIREVVIRVRNVLARYADAAPAAAPAGPERLAFDDTVVDLTAHSLRRGDGGRIELTETEFRLLEMFVTHPGRVISRDELNQMLRGRDWSPLDRTLDGHVARLRRKVEADEEEPRLIRSVRGVGYVFASEVRPAAAP
jgi:DNA-binding response OmpR family regulator